MDSATEKKIGQILEKLYALQPEEAVFANILDGMRSLIGCDNAIICRHSLLTKQALQVCLTHPFSQTAYLESVNATGAALDHPLWDAIADDAAAPIQLSSLMSKADWEAHPLYCEFFRYDGVADHLTVDIEEAGKISTMIGVLRSRRGFKQREADIMSCLVPHFRQAIANAKLYAISCAVSPGTLESAGGACARWPFRGLRELSAILDARHERWSQLTGLSPAAIDRQQIMIWALRFVDWLLRGGLDAIAEPFLIVGPQATIRLSTCRNWQSDGFMLLEQYQPVGTVAPAALLTPREQEVLRWIAEGKTDAEIALILGLRPYTVKDYCKSLYRKLGVRNRTEAARSIGRL